MNQAELGDSGLAVSVGESATPRRFHGERSKSVSTGFSDWRGVPNDPDRPLGGIVEFSVNSERIGDFLLYASLGMTGPA